MSGPESACQQFCILFSECCWFRSDTTVTKLATTLEETRLTTNCFFFTVVLVLNSQK